MADTELGLFLRTRRQAVTPAQVGLAAGSRRRTPGLRRSELATLAGVSVEYVTRLEQGRDRHPSAQVLSALADALRMTGAERIHLHHLVKAADPGFNCRGGDSRVVREVRPTVRAILDRLDPTPAVVINPVYEVLASTEGYRRLMAPSGLFDAPAVDGLPNLAAFVLTDPRARTLYPDWDATADEIIANLKDGPFRRDPDIAALSDELTLTAGSDYTSRVDSVSGPAAASGITRLRHPDAGDLRLAYEVLTLPVDDALQLIIQLPADPGTATALDRLIGRRPGTLHAVAG